ncbi:unnamed protein product [Sphagnum jensenii]
MANVETQIHKIGDLLVELGLVSQKDLNEALQIGRDTGLPIGRVLTMSAFITEEWFQLALKAQQLLKDGLITVDGVKSAIHRIDDGMDPDTAFAQFETQGQKPTNAAAPVRLGELLVAAGFTLKEQIESAVAQSTFTGLPTGRLLVLSGILQESLLTAALNAQVLIRDGRITKEQAIDGLKAAKRRQVPIEVSLAEKGFYALPNKTSIRVGELLSKAGLVSDTEIMNAIEVGLTENKPIGEVLLQLGRIQEPFLNYALELQKEIGKDKISPAQAIDLLSKARKEGLPQPIDPKAQKAPSPPKPPEPQAPKETITLVKFLKLLKRITDDDITSALQFAVKDNQLFASLLLKAGVLDANNLKLVTDLMDLLDRQVVNMERASILYEHCLSKGCSIEQALTDLSWQQQPAQATRQSVTQNKMAALQRPPGTKTHTKMSAKKASQTQTIALWESVRKGAEDAFAKSDWANAEQLWRQALKVVEPFGESDARFAYSMEKLAECLLNMKRFNESEPLYLHSHALKLKILGPDHLSIAASLNNLSKLYYFQSKFDQAEPLARQFVEICEKNLGPEHPDVACGIHNLATLYHTNGKLDLAETQYQKALAICRKTLGNEHPATVRLLKSFASLLQSLHREEEAAHLDACAQGTITGSWKIISIASDQALHNPNDIDSEELV